MSLIHLTLACGERLHVHRFSVRESISSPFTVKVLARSPDPSIDLDAVLDQPAALRIAGAGRAWSGICNGIQLVQAVALRPDEVGLSTYEISIVPRLWLLSRRTDYRIFQHLAIPDIAGAVLRGWGIEASWQIDAAEHPRLVYKVQYGETDLDFLSRLLEEAGIAYTFANDGDGEGDDSAGSRLALWDALRETAPRRETPIAHVESPTERSPRELVTRVTVHRQTRPDAVTIRDHDFQRPTWGLVGEARQPSAGRPIERVTYQPSAFLVDRGGAAHENRYGALLAARALEGERADRCVISLDTNAADLHAGQIMVVEGHPRPELDPRVGLLITSISIDGSPHGDWTIHATTIPASTPWRPARRTPKPSVYGVQSAIVVGPPGQEIHTDEHGRVRVQFPWDRDAQGSCWLRVAQGWAGAGLGLFALPRVGQEVLVAFLNGDPDAPIIVDRVSNALNPPPLRLPEDATQSVWRTATTPGGDGFNEIRLEDKKGAELVSLHAQRDMALAVKHDQAKVVGGDETARTEGRLTGYVGKDAHQTVEGEHRERIGGKRSLTVEGDQHQHIAGSAALDAGGPIHIRSATSLVIEAPDITLRATGGFVRVNGSGVTTGGGYTQIKDGAPGEGQGSDPALPAVPLRADQERGRPRLPLFEFPSVPKRDWPNKGRPLNQHEQLICRLICECMDAPLQALCVRKKLELIDHMSGGMSPYKTEVPYDMSKSPPAPIPSNNEPWRPTTGRPKDSMVPDVTVVKDPSAWPTQDNIEEVIEVKFNDRLSKKQDADYRRIAGHPDKFRVLDPEECGCPARRKLEVPVADLAKAAAALVVALLLLKLLLGPAAGGVLVPLLR